MHMIYATITLECYRLIHSDNTNTPSSGVCPAASSSRYPSVVFRCAAHVLAGDGRGPRGVTVGIRAVLSLAAAASFRLGADATTGGGRDKTYHHHHHHHHHRSSTRILTTAPSTSASASEIEHRGPAAAPPPCSTGVRHRQNCGSAAGTRLSTQSSLLYLL